MLSEYSAARSCLTEHCERLARIGIEEHSGSKSSLCFHWRSNHCCSLALGKWALSASAMFFWGFLNTFFTHFLGNQVVVDFLMLMCFIGFPNFCQPQFFQCFPPNTGDWWRWEGGREGRCQERQQQQCRNKQQQQQHQVNNAVKVPFWKFVICFDFFLNF